MCVRNNSQTGHQVLWLPRQATHGDSIPAAPTPQPPAGHPLCWCPPGCSSRSPASPRKPPWPSATAPHSRRARPLVTAVPLLSFTPKKKTDPREPTLPESLTVCRHPFPVSAALPHAESRTVSPRGRRPSGPPVPAVSEAQRLVL